MCEFCLKQGEGEKWYLQAKNYSEDLLSDMHRIKFLEQFSDPKAFELLRKNASGMERLKKMPWFIGTLLGRLFTRKTKKLHF